MEGLTHTVVCFVMVGNSTVKSVSNTVAAGPEVTQSPKKGLCLSSFVSTFASERITFNQFGSFYQPEPTVNHCFSTNFTLREL